MKDQMFYKNIDEKNIFRPREVLQSMAFSLGYSYISEMYDKEFMKYNLLGPTANHLGVSESAVKRALSLCGTIWCKKSLGGNNRKLTKEVVIKLRREWETERFNIGITSFAWYFISREGLDISDSAIIDVLKQRTWRNI